MRGLRHRPPAPRALTLVEICLVLALLVVLASFAVPMMQGGLARAELVGAGDMVRGAWAKARLAAIESGQIHAFRCQPAGSQFQVVPLGNLNLPETSELALDPVEAAPTDMLRLALSRLPENVTFVHAEIAGSNEVLATMPGILEGSWSTPILFYPDGTTSDASLLLTGSRGTSIRVTLRGLTGVASVTDPATEVTP